MPHRHCIFSRPQRQAPLEIDMNDYIHTLWGGIFLPYDEGTPASSHEASKLPVLKGL